MAVDRRRFLRLTAGLAGTTMAGFVAIQALGTRRRRAGLASGADVEGWYGPLASAGPELALPEGFEYRRMGIADAPMADGFATPGAHDGMAAFPLPNGNIRLIRNHERGRLREGERRPTPQYDPRAAGGTTSLEIDPQTREIVNDHWSLCGTGVNCAGGPTPWGSWLTCEETVLGLQNGLTRPHGYVFEVPVDATGPVEPVPLVGMGRFEHEAVAVDPRDGTVYLTEDRQRGGLYRFQSSGGYAGPGTRPDLNNGTLSMLAVDGDDQLDTAVGRTVGVPLPVRWVPIDDHDPADAETRPSAVFDQGWEQGGARFRRVEGAWWGDDGAYFSCTNGGDAERGQIWHFEPQGDGGILTLIFESPDRRVLDYPDNLCVSPRGGVVICEDGGEGNWIRGLTPRGELFDFAQNVANDSEITGATFSPDGRTLFFNFQWDPGATFAVWGPWENGGL